MEGSETEPIYSLTDCESLWWRAAEFNHKTWCSCPDARRHVPGWLTMADRASAAEVTDEDIIAALEEAEK